MRTIKFRAWDKTTNEMYVNVGIDSNDIHPRCINGGGLDCLRQKVINDVELMQFTGLLDKNGVEIFEGDVVKTDRCTGQIKYETQGACYHMKWIDKSQVHRYRELQATEGGDDYCCSWFEVIGNIHENPELLT